MNSNFQKEPNEMDYCDAKSNAHSCIVTITLIGQRFSWNIAKLFRSSFSYLLETVSDNIVDDFLT